MSAQLLAAQQESKHLAAEAAAAKKELHTLTSEYESTLHTARTVTSGATLDPSGRFHEYGKDTLTLDLDDSDGRGTQRGSRYGRRSGSPPSPGFRSSSRASLHVPRIDVAPNDVSLYQPNQPKSHRAAPQQVPKLSLTAVGYGLKGSKLVASVTPVPEIVQPQPCSPSASRPASPFPEFEHRWQTVRNLSASPAHLRASPRPPSSRPSSRQGQLTARGVSISACSFYTV